MGRGRNMNRIAYMVLRNIIRVPGWFYRIGKLGREDDSHTDQERYDYLRKINREGKPGRGGSQLRKRA